MLIEKSVSFDLPVPWIAKHFACSQVGEVNYLVGPNGSGKSRFVDILRGQIAMKTRLLGTDRLQHLSRDLVGLFGDNFQAGFNKQWFAQLKTAGQNSGAGIDAFVLLEERADLRLVVQATLSEIFNREITLEWNSGILVPKATFGSSSYRLDKDECHGIKELLVLLTHLYDNAYEALIVDEPELNLHPQLQAFFIQECRRIISGQLGFKKIIFLVTHSPFILDIRSIDDVKSIISFNTIFEVPKKASFENQDQEARIQKLIPRINVHHKQIFFSDNPVFVEGIIDAQLVEAIQLKRGLSVIASGSCIIDAGGCEEITRYVELCKAFDKKAFFLYDLDSLFTGSLRACLKGENEISDFLRTLGVGGNFAVYCGQLDKELTSAIDTIRQYSLAEPVVLELKSNLDKLLAPTDRPAKSLAKARLLLLIAIARHRSIIIAVLGIERIKDIEGRLSKIVEALSQVRIILLSKGAIEHYLPSFQGNIFELSPTAKNAALSSELELLLSDTNLDLSARYGELFHAICQLPAKKSVDFAKRLKEYAATFIHNMQNLLVDHPQWQLDDVKQYYVNHPTFEAQLFSLIKLVRTNDVEGRFTSEIRVSAPDGERLIRVTNETNAGMRKFEFESV